MYLCVPFEFVFIQIFKQCWPSIKHAMTHSAYALHGIGFIENRMKINLPKRQDLPSAIKVKGANSRQLQFHLCFTSTSTQQYINEQCALELRYSSSSKRSSSDLLSILISHKTKGSPERQRARKTTTSRPQSHAMGFNY